MTSPRWALVLLVLAIFSGFLLQPGTVLFSPHSDFLTVHFPARYLFSESIRNFQQLPRWCPYQFLGSPLLGDWHCQWFYPFTWLNALVTPMETMRMLGYQMVIHLVLAGFGMNHYLKNRGLSPQACLLGAVIFMLNGKWVAQTMVAQAPIHGWCWLPWTMASMDRLQRRPSLVETARLVALIWLLTTGSLPPIIAICVYFLACYGAFLVWHASQRLRLLGCYLAACLWSAGAICSSLWPMVEFVRLCTRGDGLTVAQASQGQVPWQILPCLPAWPISPLEIGWEMTLYSGTVPCLLALLAMLRRPPGVERFFALSSLVVHLLAMGNQTPLFGLCWKLLPGFALFRFPARYAMLLGLTFGFLAARQLDEKDPLPGRPLVGLSLVWVLLALHGWFSFGRREGGLSLVLLALAGALRLGPKHFARPLLVVLTVVELGYFSFGLVDPRTPAETLPPHLLAEEIARSKDQGRTLVTFSQMLSLPYATLNRVDSSNGLTALVPKVCLDYLLKDVCAESVDPSKVLTGIPPLKPESEVALRRGNVHFVVSERPLSLSWPSRRTQPFLCYNFLENSGFFQMPSLYLYHDPDPLPRYRLVSEVRLGATTRVDPKGVVCLEAGATVRPTTPQSAEVQWNSVGYQARAILIKGVKAPGAYLVLSEPYYPGWRLREGNSEIPLLRADGYFMAAYLEAGDHQLTLEYSPASFTPALVISAASLTMVLGVLLVAFFHKGARNPRPQ